MKAIAINGGIESYSMIPNVWKGVFNYHNATTHYQDGWRDVISPAYNSTTEKLGSLKIDGDNITYEVIPLNDEEIRSRVSHDSEIQKEQVIQERLKNQVVEQFQLVENDNELLENSFMFPFWEVGINIGSGNKFQAFDGQELKLYKVVQAHTTQSDWHPSVTPALFTRVAPSGQVLAWVQPAGAHDSYELGTKVTHKGQTWQSTHNGANSWEPGVFGWVVA